MEIDVAEIRLVGEGFTSKKLNPTTSLYYGVYPAEGRSARYYSAWSVEDPARRGRCWMSVDPLAGRYPGWSDSTSAATLSLTPLRRGRLLKQLLLPIWETVRLWRENNCPQEAE